MFEQVELNVPGHYALAAVYFIGRDSIGRRRLADRLGLTESKTRTMLEHLRGEGYVTAGETMELTSRGEKVFEQVDSRLKELKQVDPELSVDEVNYAALVSADVDSELELRDAAVRAGATGMLVLEYNSGFVFPDGSETEELKPLDDAFDASDGNFLLVSSAGSMEEAKAGLWSAIEHMLGRQ